MSKETEQMINRLMLDERSKRFLKEADKVINSGSVDAKDTSFITIVKAENGCEVSEFGRAFSQIVDKSIPLTVKGKSTYLELVFPKDNERDERLFFASPRRIVSVRNRFYGTMLISLGEYESCHEKEFPGIPSIKNLLMFMEKNKQNISFIIHITPDFGATKSLMKMLREMSPVEMIDMEKPDAEAAYTFAMDWIKQKEIRTDDESRKYIKEIVLPQIVAGNSYTGYPSIEQFLDRLNLERAKCTGKSKDMIDRSMLDIVIDKMAREEEQQQEEHLLIGFRR